MNNLTLTANYTENDLYRLMAKHLPRTVVVIFDHDLRYLLAEGNALSLLGLEASAIVGKTLHDIVPAQSTPALESLYRATLSGQMRDLDFFTSTGRFYQLRSFPLQDQNGQILAGMIIADDITREYQSKLRYQAIVEDQTELICRFYPDSTLIYVNDAYCRYHQQEREVILGRKFVEMMDQEEWRIVAEKLDSLTPVNHTVNYDLYTHVNGEMRWQNWSDHGMFDTAGTLIEIQSVGRDITAQKLAELALRESEERFRIIANITHDFLFDWDLKTNRGWLSGKYERLLGINSNQPFDLEGWLKRVHPDDQAGVRDAFDAVLQRHEETIAIEFRFRKLDKSYITLEAHAHVMRDEQGQPARMLGALTDVTDQRLAEQQATRLALEKERVRTLTDFISAFSHDFRTPLSVINTSLYLIPRMKEAEKLFSHLDKMQSQVELMEKMIEGMVMIARLDETEDLSFKPCDINRMLREVINSLHKRIEHKRQEVTFEKEDLPFVPADESYLYQAFWNLIDNAVQYTPDQGSIRLATRQQETEVMIEIADSGPGIDEVDLPRIFMPLYRGHENDHRPMGSSGMGLPIVDKILTRHGGRITVESTPTSGTTFRVFLPIAKSVQSGEQ